MARAGDVFQVFENKTVSRVAELRAQGVRLRNEVATDPWSGNLINIGTFRRQRDIKPDHTGSRRQMTVECQFMLT